MKTLLKSFAAAAVTLPVLSPTAAQACAVCFSGADKNTGEALNGAIFLMLGCLAFMFAFIVAVAVNFLVRSRRLEQHPDPAAHLSV